MNGITITVYHEWGQKPSVIRTTKIELFKYVGMLLKMLTNRRIVIFDVSWYDTDAKLTVTASFGRRDD